MSLSADFFMTVLIAVIVILAIPLLIRILLLIRRSKTDYYARKRGIVKRIFSAVGALGMAVVLIAVSVGNVMALHNFSAVADLLFRDTDTSEAAAVSTSQEDWIALAREIGEEGMILLTNNHDTLPLDVTENDGKINLLGYCAYNPVYTGSGSSLADTSSAIDFVTSLENAGFTVNPAMKENNVYDISEEESLALGFASASFAITEAPLDHYTGDASFESMKEYSDIAILVIGRTGGEGQDLTDFDGDEDKIYLELSDTERELLEKASETFDTLIVLYNGANAMELGFLEEYDVDACLNVGIPGANGLVAVGEILSGVINPSGRTVDTFVYDLNSSPVSENYADQLAENADEYYVDYVEGIYVGYKWYETAYAENAVITNTDTGDTFDYSDYSSIVQFPFGYGLSYTEFTQEIVGGLTDDSSLSADDELTIQVKVTNVGDVSGKEVVQVYVTTPYTDYDKENGVEKAAVTLAGYGKTAELAPGESEVVEVTIAMEDIASYNMNYDNGDGTCGCYMLDAGEYVFSVREDSHTELTHVTAVLKEDIFYSGDNKRSDDEQQAYNQFEDVARGIYLSRADGFANYAEAMAAVSASIEDLSFSENPNSYDESIDANIPEMVKGVDYDADGNLTLEDLKGVDYDDEQWDILVDQLSIDEMITMIRDTSFIIPGADSVGTDTVYTFDGPLGITSMFGSVDYDISMPSIPMLAATFNDELAYKYGCEMADCAHANGITGWYAPAMNIHRSAYSGRNFEYYSEDAALSAGIASAETLGATDNGIIVFLKHFALNDMESNRSNMLHTYCNEQAMREVYLKPFEECVKNGHANGIMTSMNYIGDTYSSARADLCTEVLRNEWGFIGIVVEDMPEGDYQITCADAAVRAGTDGWLGKTNLTFSTESDADIYYLQRAAKHILQAESTAHMIPAGVKPWRLGLYVIDAEIVAFAVLGIVIRLKRRQAR